MENYSLENYSSYSYLELRNITECKRYNRKGNNRNKQTTLQLFKKNIYI